jgi:hypothetical protein
MLNQFDFDYLRNLAIGTVDSVSPSEIKVLLDTDAPQNTALNTGIPSLFPRINGFVLIPNEIGALVGLISWIGVEHSSYPKRKGYKDFDLIDLPFPLRKMSINPIGTLKQKGKIEEKNYELERGVYSFPSIGDSVILPSEHQLAAIVENNDRNAFVTIGRAPIAGNAQVKIDPDKLFGRHLAVLGNTGSGKSCSVAGLIRWSLEAAYNNRKDSEKPLNARFIVFDPNGEYSHSFDDLNIEVIRYKVEITEEDAKSFQQLKVPAWFWNSFEWSSFSQASGRTQRPILRRALREIKAGAIGAQDEILNTIRRHFSSCFLTLRNDLSTGVSAFGEKSGRTDFGKKLQRFARDARHFQDKAEKEINEELQKVSDTLDSIATSKFNSFTNKQGEEVNYFEGFDVKDVNNSIHVIEALLSKVGGIIIYEGPDEDTPLPFNPDDLPNHIEALALEQGVSQFLDFLLMRIRTMLSDTRMKSIIGKDDSVTLENWLNSHINGVIVIDLSLVPSDVVHLIVAVIARIIFEALQRYRKENNKELPTVITLEEAHNFIRKGHETSDEISATSVCSETFEKIAREGRKYGLSLLVSSQRPFELSPTVLSQCNTFLLHRIVNDKDQELVGKFVPDNIGGLLRELPILPTRKAILLGFAAPIPMLIEMNELEEKYRPRSSDPHFWDVWTGNEKREIDWKKIADEWQAIRKSNMDNKPESKVVDEILKPSKEGTEKQS